MKYTAQQIREQRICFENLTQEQFNKLKAHFQKLYPNDDYTTYQYAKSAISFRFYPDKENISDTISALFIYEYTDDNKATKGIKASKSITFDQFDFEETSKSEYPKVMWVWNNSRNNPIKKKRVVFTEKCGKYISWNNAETLKDAEKSLYASSWDNVEDIIEEPQPEQLTKQQVADLLGKDINSFEII